MTSEQIMINYMKKVESGTSLVVQWLRVQAPSAGVLGSIPGWKNKTKRSTQHETKTFYSDIVGPGYLL